MTEAKPPRTSWFRRLGPGLITGAADDDPGGIATHSQVGAQFGFNLMWTVALTYPLLTAIQAICARIGRVTGEGLAANMAHVLPRWLGSASDTQTAGRTAPNRSRGTAAPPGRFAVCRRCAAWP